MRDSQPEALFQRLRSIGAILCAITMAVDFGPSAAIFPNHGVPTGESASIVWQSSDASTFALERGPSRVQIEHALRETRTAISILGQSELHREAAFIPFVEAIEAALIAYENTPKWSRGEAQFAAALAMARAALEGSVERASSWRTVVACLSSHDHFAAVPERFCAPSRPLLARADDGDTVAAWLDLDSADV